MSSGGSPHGVGTGLGSLWLPPSWPPVLRPPARISTSVLVRVHWAFLMESSSQMWLLAAGSTLTDRDPPRPQPCPGLTPNDPCLVSALDLWRDVHPPSDQQHTKGGLLGPPGEKVYVRSPHRHGRRAQENVTTGLSSGWIQSPATMPGTHGVGVERGGWTSCQTGPPPALCVCLSKRVRAVRTGGCAHGVSSHHGSPHGGPRGRSVVRK